MSIMYHFGRSRRGSKQIISSDLYSYNVFRTNKNGTTKWQCVVRNKFSVMLKFVNQEIVFCEMYRHPDVPSCVHVRRNIIIIIIVDIERCRSVNNNNNNNTIGCWKKRYVSARNLHSNIKFLQIRDYYCIRFTKSKSCFKLDVCCIYGSYIIQAPAKNLDQSIPLL